MADARVGHQAGAVDGSGSGAACADAQDGVLFAVQDQGGSAQVLELGAVPLDSAESLFDRILTRVLTGLLQPGDIAATSVRDRAEAEPPVAGPGSNRTS